MLSKCNAYCWGDPLIYVCEVAFHRLYFFSIVPD